MGGHHGTSIAIAAAERVVVAVHLRGGVHRVIGNVGGAAIHGHARSHQPGRPVIGIHTNVVVADVPAVVDAGIASGSLGGGVEQQFRGVGVVGIERRTLRGCPVPGSEKPVVKLSPMGAKASLSCVCCAVVRADGGE